MLPREKFLSRWDVTVSKNRPGDADGTTGTIFGCAPAASHPAADDGGKSVKQKKTFCRFTAQSLLSKNQRAQPRAGQSIGKVRGQIRPLLAPVVINDAVPLADATDSAPFLRVASHSRSIRRPSFTPLGANKVTGRHLIISLAADDGH